MFYYFFTYSQNKVGYYYDNNGNRYQRYFIGVKPARQDTLSPADSILNTLPGGHQAQTAEQKKEEQQLVTDYGIKLYPNPTRDIITLSMTRNNEKEQLRATTFLLDNVGRMIESKEYSGTDLNFNLTGMPAGNYYLKLVFDDRKSLAYIVIKIN